MNFLHLPALFLYSPQYGVSAEEAAAAGMRRPMQKYNCISCNRPLVPEYRDPAPCKS